MLALPSFSFTCLEIKPWCSITECGYIRMLVPLSSQALPGSEVSDQYDDDSESDRVHSEARGATMKLS